MLGGVGSERYTVVPWIRVCVWGVDVPLYFHPSVPLTYAGSSGVPSTVLGVGSGDEHNTQVHGLGDPRV